MDGDVAKEWFSVEEAAAYLGVSRRTVYQLTKDSRLPAYTVGSQRIRRFRKADLDRALRPLRASATLTPFSDPVLEELWDNEYDRVYDDL
jgi:excisionase family DNA binding protein